MTPSPIRKSAPSWINRRTIKFVVIGLYQVLAGNFQMVRGNWRPDWSLLQTFREGIALFGGLIIPLFLESLFVDAWARRASALE
jgi:hypothetical protein